MGCVAGGGEVGRGVGTLATRGAGVVAAGALGGGGGRVTGIVEDSGGNLWRWPTAIAEMSAIMATTRAAALNPAAIIIF